MIIFDVNETLSDMSAMGTRFGEVGAPAHLAPLWFATTLRDGFALAAVGAARPFAHLGAEALRALFRDVELRADAALGLDGTPEAAIEHVLTGMERLPLHPDVAEGLKALRASGFRLVTLSNGSVQVAERLLAAAGLREEFEAVLSVEDAGIWKPGQASYDYAVRACGTDPGEALLVAVHPWDVDGAARAGLATAWIDRAASPYPTSFTPATWTARSLIDLQVQLAGDDGRSSASG